MRIRAAFVIPFLLAGATAPGAEDPRPPEEIVRAIDEEERVAALKRDVRALEQLWSDQLVVNAPNNRVVIGKNTILEEFLFGGVVRFSAFERRVELIRVDGDYAFVMGGETVRPDGGPSAGQDVQRRFTNVWKKEGGAWRLFARHASVIPKG